MKVLIIVPAFNEGKNLVKTINKLTNLNQEKNWQLDYLIINDGSTDNTREICEKNNFKVINLVENLGIGGAVQTGYKYAYYNNYDIAIQFDGDGQHDENYINLLIKEIENGNDMVIGSRFISNLSEFRSSLARRFGSKIISSLIFLVTGVKIYDPTSGFRAINKRVIKEFCYNYPIEYPEPESITYLLKKKAKVKEVAVNMHKRENGKSSINAFKSAYYMFSVSISIIATSIFHIGGKK